jgi:hypothetical protein
MVTFTYRPEAEWHPNHMRQTTTHYREWFRRQGVPFRYQWVLELTKRGVPHYHLLLWVPKGWSVPMADDRGWWPHGMTRTERCTGSGVGYLVKYATKGPVYRCGEDGALEETPLPPGARLFGVGGLDDLERLTTHRAGLPRWLAERTTARCGRVRGGWLDRTTGELLKSPYRLSWGVNADGSSFVLVTLVSATSQPD